MAYQKITRGYETPLAYATPEEQGAAIKKYTILEPVNIEFSDATTIIAASNE